jgi:hypothetical protein
VVGLYVSAQEQARVPIQWVDGSKCYHCRMRPKLGRQLATKSATRA